MMQMRLLCLIIPWQLTVITRIYLLCWVFKPLSAEFFRCLTWEKRFLRVNRITGSVYSGINSCDSPSCKDNTLLIPFIPLKHLYLHKETLFKLECQTEGGTQAISSQSNFVSLATD